MDLMGAVGGGRAVLVVAVVAMIAAAGCVGGVADPAEEGDDGLDEEPPATNGAEDGGGDVMGAADDGDAIDADGDADDGGTPDGGAAEGVEGELEVHAIDVGQADATLIVGPEGTMLIDSGDWRDDGDAVIEYLENQGVERIDYLVTTHAHADHIGGHAAVIEHYETDRDGVGQVWDPGVAHTSQTYEDYLDAVEEHDVDLIEAREGDEIPFEGADVRLFNPPAESDSDDLHYNSTTVHVEHGDRAFLFTGDAEDDAEERIAAEYGDELSADVYQAGHHGSSTSSTDAFLDRVDPEATVVSSAYDSQYGHPHDEVLDRFDEYGIDTYWTGVHGTTVFVSDGETIGIHTQVDATTDPTAIRDESEADADTTEEAEERDAIERIAAEPWAVGQAPTAVAATTVPAATAATPAQGVAA
jgi:competence protein ComEC